jgi:hypothetical protein
VTRILQVVEAGDKGRIDLLGFDRVEKLLQRQGQRSGLMRRRRHFLGEPRLRIGAGPVVDQVDEQQQLRGAGHGVGDVGTGAGAIAAQRVFVDVADGADGG